MADHSEPNPLAQVLRELEPPPPPFGKDPLARLAPDESSLDPATATGSKKVQGTPVVAWKLSLANDLETEFLNDLQGSLSSTPPRAAPVTSPSDVAPPANPQPAAPASAAPIAQPTAAIAVLHSEAPPDGLEPPTTAMPASREKEERERVGAPLPLTIAAHAAPPTRERRRGMFLAGGGALIAFIMIVVVAFITVRSESRVAAPATIIAHRTASEIVPADTAAEDHDRVDGTDSADETKLMAPGDDKVAALPGPPGGDKNPVFQVADGKLPPSASPFIPPSADAAAGAPSGTHIDAGSDDGKGSAIPVKADSPSINDDRDKADGDDSVAIALAAGSPEPGSVPATDGAAAFLVSDNGGAAAGDASALPATHAIVPIPRTKPTDRPVIASRGPTEKKVGKSPPPAVTASAGVFVQLSAQKSKSAAQSTYHDLQVKFPTILSKLGPDIQRADLGDNGVYYRVRIGPFASAEAQKICDSYRAAGGDCLIARQ